MADSLDIKYIQTADGKPVGVDVAERDSNGNIIKDTYLNKEGSTSDLNLNNHKIINLSSPTSSTDGANKQYVDTIFAKIKQFQYVVSSKAADTPYGIEWYQGTTKITGLLIANASTMNIIYLVPCKHNVVETQKGYDEYLTLSLSDGFKWEVLGNTQDIDLKDYATVNYVKTNTSLATNLENGSGSTAIQMKQDGTSGTFSFTGKNPNATALDSSLTGDITYGGTGAFATTLGGKGTAIGKRSVSQGTTTIAKGSYSHAEGDNSVALGSDSHAEGYATTSKGEASHSEGNSTQAIGNNSHAEGNATISNAFGSHSEGRASTTLASVPSSGGGGSSDEPPASEPDKYLGYYSHAEGENTVTLGYAAHSEGAQTKAYGHWSHAEGLNSTTGVVNDRTKGKAAHASGINTKAIGNYSSATGDASSSTGESSIATGKGTESTGLASISGGQNTHATSDLAVALGYSSTASGWASFAFGSGAKAIGSMSVAFGEATEMTASSGMAIGKFNVPNSSALFQVGNGTSDTHKNAFEVLNDGTAKVGAMGSETLSVATKGYVDNVIAKTGNLPEPPDTTGTYVLKASVSTTSSTETISTSVLVGAVPSGSSAYTNITTLKTNLVKGSLYLQVSGNNTNWSNVGYDDSNGGWSGRTDISVNYDTGEITVYVAASSLDRTEYYLRISTYKYNQTTTSKTLSWVKE